VGIVATLARLMEAHECFIASSRTFGDTESGQFFARLVFRAPEGGEVPLSLLGDIEEAAEELEADWSVAPVSQRMKTLLLVSQSDHCANTLLYASRRKELPIDVVGHRLQPRHAEGPVRPFRPALVPHVPVTSTTKPEAEARLFNVIEETGADLVVLARYMQVLSDNACRELEGRCINIHHSFLPSFKGARPYHQAHARGVKVIGATAHYVTADLDEGPIITQVTETIDHTYTPADMIETGRHLEGTALLRAVKAHAEHRVFSHAGRTIVFAR
jgi:formyltetrahydrofolate deformylase